MQPEILFNANREIGFADEDRATELERVVLSRARIGC
jgi:hypothetical protein